MNTFSLFGDRELTGIASKPSAPSGYADIDPNQENVYEWSPFCLYCGGYLQIVGPGDPNGNRPTFGVCLSCRESWARVFDGHGCPACGDESGMWIHLHSASHVEVTPCNPPRVTRANGYGICECGQACLWSWKQNPFSRQSPTIEYTAIATDGTVKTTRRDTRDAIGSDS